jgi:hypothetical protein
MTNPKLEKLQEDTFNSIKEALGGRMPIVKTQAGLSDMLSRAAMIGAVGLGLNALVDAASAPVGSVKNQVGKAVGYQKMLEGSPELQQMPSMQVKNMFDVLHSFAPDIASQPVAAAGIVSNMAQYDTVDHKTIQDLITMQKNYAETHRGSRKEAPGLTQAMLTAATSIFS